VRAKRLLYLLLALAVALVAASCGGGDGDGGEQAEGTGEVTVLSLWGGSEKEAFEKVLAGFTEKTNIRTKYETARDFLPVIRTRLAAGNPPMVAIVPRPGIVADLARDGSLISFSDLGLDAEGINENYSEAWTDLTTIDGETYGVVAKANSKSTVWYKPASLQELGAQPPETWEQLLQLTEQYKEAGKTPWAVGAGDGWPLTDWFESIYLYQHGPEKYEQLFAGEIEFTDQSVKDSLNEMVKIINGENLPGGIEAALGTAFVDSIGLVFGENARAELYYEGGFVGGIAVLDVNPDLVWGETIDFFPFPPVDGSGEGTITIGGDVMGAFTNNPGVEEFMKYLASPEGAAAWIAGGTIITPFAGVEPGDYPDERTQAEAQHVADASVVRYDGADLLAAGADLGASLSVIFNDPGQLDSQLETFQAEADAAWAEQGG
jgi:alpha-glucoside transport system substrate-binding protein